LEKYHAILNCVIWEKEIILFHIFYFLVAQAFLFFEQNIVLKILVLFKKTPQMFSLSVFTENQESVSFN